MTLSADNKYKPHLTYDDRLVLYELQLPQAGGIDEENVLLPVDAVGLVDVTKNMQP